MISLIDLKFCPSIVLFVGAHIPIPGATVQTVCMCSVYKDELKLRFAY